MIVYTLQPTEEELKIFFDKFDKEKKGYIEATQVMLTCGFCWRGTQFVQIASILKTMGVQFNTQVLRDLIKEFDEDGECF